MSLSINGIWATGVWDQTTWAENVWREGAPTVARGDFNICAYFPTGQTDVTLELYLAPSWTSVTLTSNTCTEIGTTGLYYWDIANIATAPTGYTEYVFKMTDGATTIGGAKIVEDFTSQFITHNEVYN